MIALTDATTEGSWLRSARRVIGLCPRFAASGPAESPRDRRPAQPLAAAIVVIGTVIAVAVAGTAEAALARIWSRASASEKATCVGPTPESPSEAASLPASPQRPTTIGNAANRARSRRTW
jgi:hypothetical protein